MGSERYRFGAFELNLRQLELRESGRVVRLPHQPARLLAFLVQRAGEIVSREDLGEAVWGKASAPGLDQNLNTCIRQIRRALRDQAQGARFVETLPKRGYRFLAEVVVEEDRPAADPPTPPERPASKLLIVVPLVALLSLLLWWWPDSPKARDRVVRPDGRLRIVVLPFTEFGSTGDQGALADSLTEETISQLARIQPRQISVIARTSAFTYKGRELSVADIGSELDVDYVVEGSLTRRDQVIRVTVRLVDAYDESPCFSDTFVRAPAELYALPTSLAEQLVTSLHRQGSMQAVGAARGSFSASHAVGFQAYETYLRGRFEWNRFDSEGLARSIDLYQAALELDPGFALAHASLAESYALEPFHSNRDGFQGLRLCRAAAENALALDPAMARAHNALGFALLYHAWDFPGSAAAFRRALEIEPGYAMLHHWYAAVLAAAERHDEAIEHIQRAARLDPLSLSVRSDLAWYLLYADRKEAALAEAERALQRSPGDSWALAALVEATRSLGRFEECRRALEQGLSNEGVELPAKAANASEREQVAALFAFQLEQGREQLESGELDPYYAAVLHARVGAVDDALNQLREALARRHPWLVFLRVEPRFDGLHNHPEFLEITRSLGLPANLGPGGTGGPTDLSR